MSPGDISFDLDSLPELQEFGEMRNLDHPELGPFLRHVSFDLDQPWRDYYGRRGQQRFVDTLQKVAATCWFDLPTALSFGLLLALRGPFGAKPSDLSRLNAARMRKGRASLLDHIEVGLSLEQRAIKAAENAREARSAPRLHQVRGHVVHRGDHLFWRTAHLRGDRNSGLLRRTVHVRG